MMMNFFRKDYLEIVLTDDRQYLIKSDKSDFIYLNKRSDAEYILSVLNKVDWNKYKTLQTFAKEDKNSYEEIATELRKYGVPKKINGNYIESLNNNIVVYKLNKDTMVQGQHLDNGIAYRKMQDGKFCLDLVYSALPWMAFNTVDHLKEFIKVTSDVIPYIKENIGHKIIADQDYTEYVNSVYRNLVNSSYPIIEIPIRKKAGFEYDLYINDGNEEKKTAYIDAMEELNTLYGLNSIKAKMNSELLNREADQALKRIKVKTNGGLHSLFVGPPGTGKTQVARIVAKLYWAMGYIKNNKLVEVSKEDLVSKYVGGTEEQTNLKIEEAMGGALFVDEAYTLVGKTNAEGKEDYGRIALEIIMRAMENNRDNLFVIFAGYEKEIQELLSVNPGLNSRFNDKLVFENYTTKELAQISNDMIQQQGFDTKEIQNELIKLYEKKTTNGVLQGNARAARSLVEKIIKNHKENIVKKNGSLLTIAEESVKSLYFSPTLKIDSKILEYKEIGLRKLNSLTGLQKLKSKINTWANYLTIEVKRSQITGNLSKMRLHMTFEGPPGTGKTTVARLMGSILKGVGVLENGHVVEVMGKDLVAGYQGQTTKKVQDYVTQAKGGILFIDEAYSMVKSESDIFGKEAVDALITLMENKGSEFVVILGGYSKEIAQLLNTNPGFQSRIAERFEFTNYSSTEIMNIFNNTIASNEFIIEGAALKIAENYINEKYNEKNCIEGNGRWVRNFFEKIKLEQANRLVKENTMDEEELFKIKDTDIKKVIELY